MTLQMFFDQMLPPRDPYAMDQPPTDDDHQVQLGVSRGRIYLGIGAAGEIDKGSHKYVVELLPDVAAELAHQLEAAKLFVSMSENTPIV